MTLHYTVREFRAVLIRLSALLVGGGTVEFGTVRIVVVATPGKPDEQKEPVDGSAAKEVYEEKR